MRKIMKIGMILIALLSMVGSASATATASPDEITINVLTDAVTVVTVTHEGNFEPDEIKCTLREITSAPFLPTSDIEASWIGTTAWSNTVTTDLSTAKSHTWDSSTSSSYTVWEIEIRDVPGSDDTGQMDKLYRATFDVTDDQGNYDTSSANIDTSNTNVIPVPEFPTIALPVAAILGLVFIFQRRREE